MRSLVALLVLCVGLFSYIYFAERKTPSTDEIKRTETQLFAKQKVDKDTINYIKIKKGDKELILEKKEGKWLCEGKEVKDYKINSLVSGISSYRYRYKVGAYDEALKKECGFEKPLAEVEFRTTENAFRVIVGAETPLGGSRYVMFGNDVYVGSGSPFSSQTMDVKSWQKEEKKKEDKGEKEKLEQKDERKQADDRGKTPKKDEVKEPNAKEVENKTLEQKDSEDKKTESAQK